MKPKVATSNNAPVSDEKTKKAHENWIEGIDPSLEVMSAIPLVLSTPVKLLAENRITDKKHLFVRNIQDLDEGMTMEPLPLEGWVIELSGLIMPYRVLIQAKDLLDMEQVEYEMILQCSGNGRNNFGGIKGTPWDQGGVGNVRFTGVPLKAILARYNVQVDPQVKYITGEGQDAAMGLEKPDFEHSIPAADVLDRGILALKLNGEPLPGIHGGPVRLVTPGLFGTMQIKWLTRLRFETAESANFYHATEYRVPNTLLKPGEKFKFSLENSRPTWDIRLMSYIFEPLPGAHLKAGPVSIRGVAYNDGKAPIESVLVSIDKGKGWTPAELQIPDSPFSWYEWKTEQTLKRGTHEIWARATDALGRSQPLDGRIFWNPNGYEWTGVFKSGVTVE
ncbi:MAG TPA: molybdopterin-dependent oxidoreductase [Oligoflexus sp.]|uniref:molybdopterin-dependent oxidoreductase n=1 Tax=Oligoflexus sp. TaxID=1971216 RepID=UPI002D65B453|nr:molybdopterin-dependent oxidoreductase [Oligoflexus sp.]HYX37759.1 molybdopterin-dependent oxidoreductase [Oligoflexus sp.]